MLRASPVLTILSQSRLGPLPWAPDGEDLDDFPGLHLVIQGDDAPVHLGPHHPVAHGRMDGVGEIDDRGSHRQGNHIPLGGENENVLRGQIGLDAADDVLRVVHVLLAFDELTHPGEPLLQLILALDAQLIFPMGRNAVFGGIMHLPGADLHLKGDFFLADDGGVQRLIHIGLGGGDIILEPVGQGTEHIVDNTQHIVTVVNRVHNHPHGVDVVNFVEGTALHIHLAVNTRNALDTAGDKGLHVEFQQTLLNPFLDASQELIALVFPQGQGVLNFLVGNRVENPQRDVLQLLLDRPDAEPVSQRRVDIHGFLGLIPALLGDPSPRWCAYCAADRPA